MSLAIELTTISEVLLADGWHKVFKNSFDLDAYEFILGNIENTIHGGGSAGICNTGFEFQEADGKVISGPLTSIIAVRWEIKKRGGEQ